MRPGEKIRIEYIRPGKDVTYYEEEFFAQDETCLRTFKTLPEEISINLSNALLSQKLIEPGQRVGTISKLYFFNEPFNLLEFRATDGSLLGHYSDIGEPVIQLSPAEFQMTDLFLDLWLLPDGRLLELDWDEFEEAIEKKVITTAQADLARDTMRRLVDETKRGIYPKRYTNHFNI
jgi:predicted RNA-binding protein associated with RNAse of E/G family